MSTQACPAHLRKIIKSSYIRKLGTATPASQLAGPPKQLDKLENWVWPLLLPGWSGCFTIKEN